MILQFFMAFDGANGLVERVSECVGVEGKPVQGRSDQVEFDHDLTKDQLAKLRATGANFAQSLSTAGCLDHED